MCRGPKKSVCVSVDVLCNFLKLGVVNACCLVAPNSRREPSYFYELEANSFVSKSKNTSQQHFVYGVGRTTYDDDLS